jgi:hypothetical protein
MIKLANLKQLSLTHEIDVAWSGLKVSKFYREWMASLVFLPPSNLKANILETIRDVRFSGTGTRYAGQVSYMHVYLCVHCIKHRTLEQVLLDMFLYEV